MESIIILIKGQNNFNDWSERLTRCSRTYYHQIRDSEKGRKRKNEQRDTKTYRILLKLSCKTL